MDTNNANLKKENLISYLKGLDSLLIAFSGGVDSTFLLAVAHQVLGDRVLAGTASSATYPSQEQEEAIEFVKKQGIKHVVFVSDEVSLPEFSTNNPDRCYYCKKLLSAELQQIAKERGTDTITSDITAEAVQRIGKQAGMPSDVMKLMPKSAADFDKPRIPIDSSQLQEEYRD